VRDESAEDVRVVLEPRNRTIDPEVMMESLFKLSELESRFPMNMNVLVDGVVPRVLSLAEALRQWLDHRRDVLLRRSRHRLAEIAHRLEVLAGMLIVYLHLDEVIRIIREEDEPKQALMARFTLTEVQANYILDTRLRSLRRLEEMQLRKEYDELVAEKTGLDSLVTDEAQQWKTITWQVRDVRKKFNPETKVGKRRTTFELAPTASDIDLTEAMIEREPITVVVTEKGWIRALKGHVADLANLQFKGDDGLKLSFFAETTSKLLVLAANGKVFTLEASKLPGGRGFGEPIRLMADIEEGAEIVSVLLYTAGVKMLIASSDGRGFVVSHDEMISSTRKGRGVLTLDAPATATVLVPALGDHVATIGDNRKLLVFPIADVPEMARGKGVRLQRYKDGGICDARVFAMADGLTWKDSAGRNFTVHKAELLEWIGARAEAGRLPPKGFPKNNRFG
jgi:topoisomerase-4 subunit A